LLIQQAGLSQHFPSTSIEIPAPKLVWQSSAEERKQRARFQSLFDRLFGADKFDRLPGTFCNNPVKVWPLLPEKAVRKSA
jgi:hypothetical protein